MQHHNTISIAVLILPVQPQQKIINWGAICRNPIVDSFISEPCETLTSPDGFTLTSRGQRVLVCLGVGGIAAYLDPEILGYIKSLGPAVGCGTGTGAQTGEPSPFGQGNPLDTMASKSPYQSGYDHGARDARDDCSDGCDWYILEPGKGFSFHTKEFIDGYIDGFCDNSPPGVGSDADEATFSCP